MIRGTTYVLAHIVVADEELRSKIILSDVLVVGKSDRANARQYEVFRNLVG